MKFYKLLSASLLAMSALCSAAQAPAPSFAQMASATLDSLYTHYSIPSSTLLRENYPFDAEYKAGYLAEEAQAPNPYSYLWPFSGTLSAARALYDATADSSWLSIVSQRVLPGLEQYRDSLRTPVAYASYVNTAPQSDRFYDDNVWLGIDFADLYAATGHRPYLDKSREIWRFIQSGTDTILGGGIYWCEQKKHGKNTCSNAPGAVYALKLYAATADSAYLRQGKELYHWTRTHLQDTADCLYFDHIIVKNGHIGRAKFAYNSGQMMQAAALLFRATADSTYLHDARAIARSAYREFFPTKATDAAGNTFRRFKRGDIWFTAVMMRGYCELFLIDRDPRYMRDILANLRSAWTLMRDPSTGLFSEDWSGASSGPRKWLLTQAAMAEMFASAAVCQKLIQ